MPISFEGLPFTQHLFKPIENSETGGCHADVYLPFHSDGQPCPIALSIHGGGFTTGDTHHIFIGHFDYLLKRGIAVVSVEYRMAPHASFADMREDWLDAYKWVKKDLASVTNGRVDPERVFVFGGSAGGTATLFLGLDIVSAGLPSPQAMYCVYPAVNWDTFASGKAPVEPYDYSKFESVIAQQSPEDQKLLREMIDGPVVTSFGLKQEYLRPKSGRRVWYDLMIFGNRQMLPSCLFRCITPPSPPESRWTEMVNAKFPPTVFVQALADATLDPQNTADAYAKLQELGVESVMLQAKDMQHGDLEGENDMSEHPPREAYFWKEIYTPALDWCIERTRGTGNESDQSAPLQVTTSPQVAVHA